MSKLLLNEQPLLVMPELAAKIGLNESLILQQVHYWNEINSKANNNFKDGYYWTFNSYKDWIKQFPFWSESTIKRTITKLEKIGLLETGNYNKLKIDRTKWYRINYDLLDIVEKTPSGQVDLTMISKRSNQSINLNQPLPETNPENNSEINYLHHCTNDGVPIYNLLEAFSLKRFEKKLRKHKGIFELEEYYFMHSIEFIEILMDSILTYDQCNLNYLQEIRGRFK